MQVSARDVEAPGRKRLIALAVFNRFGGELYLEIAQQGFKRSDLRNIVPLERILLLQMLRQITCLNHVRVGADDGHLDRVLELAHISWPVVFLQQRSAPGASPVSLLL